MLKESDGDVRGYRYRSKPFARLSTSNSSLSALAETPPLPGIQSFMGNRKELDTHMLDFKVFDHTSMPVAATLDVLEWSSVIDTLLQTWTYMIPDSNPKIVMCSPFPVNLMALGITAFQSLVSLRSFCQSRANDPANVISFWPLWFWTFDLTILFHRKHIYLPSMARNDEATFGTIVIHCFDRLVEGEHIGVWELSKYLLSTKINQEWSCIPKHHLPSLWIAGK